jgi:hypothetical protein
VGQQAGDGLADVAGTEQGDAHGCSFGRFRTAASLDRRPDERNSDFVETQRSADETYRRNGDLRD